MSNYKGKLQEYCAAKKLQLPIYVSEVVSLPPNSMSTATVTVTLSNGETLKSSGEGIRKRDAEQMAAEKILETIEGKIIPVEKKRHPELQKDGYLFMVDQENSPLFVKQYYDMYSLSTFRVFATKGSTSISKLPWPADNLPSKVFLTLTPPGFKDGADISLAFELGRMLYDEKIINFPIVIVSSDKIFYGLQAYITRNTTVECLIIDG